jgi:RNA polymerase sigma-70 factor (ECF subfamily)
MNDLDIARRIATGDPESVERFVRDHYASVFRAMRHLTAHQEDAEDLTQQAFLTARARIETFRGRSSLKTWLHRIAFNEYAQWKRKKRPTAPLQLDQPTNEPGYGSFITGIDLLGALATLPDKLREAFILHEVEELRVEEVAQILRVPSGTVKARLFHARRKLRAHLEDGAEVTNHEPQEALG